MVEFLVRGFQLKKERTPKRRLLRDHPSFAKNNLTCIDPTYERLIMCRTHGKTLERAKSCSPGYRKASMSGQDGNLASFFWGAVYTPGCIRTLK